MLIEKSLFVEIKWQMKSERFSAAVIAMGAAVNSPFLNCEQRHFGLVPDTSELLLLLLPVVSAFCRRTTQYQGVFCDNFNVPGMEMGGDSCR
jgi:hypothetical protein